MEETKKFSGTIKTDSYNRKEKSNIAIGELKVQHSEFFDEPGYFIVENGIAYAVYKESIAELQETAVFEIKLNTLKDITSWTCKCGCCTFDNGVCRSCGVVTEKYGEISYNDAKAEAIKNVRIQQEKISKLFGEYNHEGVRCCEEIIAWIKNFFNITEEDLK